MSAPTTATATATDRDILVALAGNPNTGKSTVFNALTGLRQHTGNWPGKTVIRAEGTYTHAGRRHHVVDLPGTYSLLAMSPDEEVAREFLLFGEPDVTVVVVDSGRLERNLNLVFQVTAITDRVVVCLNLVDESARHGIYVNARELSRALGVPVVATSATSKEGLPELSDTITAVAEGRLVPSPTRLYALPEPIAHAGRHRFALTEEAHQRLTEAIYVEAARIDEHVVSRAPNAGAARRDLRVDRLLTSRFTGFPIMLLLFTAVFWITITGANLPSQWLSWLLLDRGHAWLTHFALAVHAPAWLHGILVDGVYLATAWVVSVMLPPMAIFFPLFTLLEDSGYLPRVAFNLDAGLRRCGAHGKQALCMMMGYGCNAAGIVSARIIDSPRERLIAMLTNNFAVCNGRWPTLILVASLFVATQVPEPLAALTAALTVVGVALLGVGLALACSWGLSRTVLRGHVSTFSLELPPYRRPKLLMTLYTSLIDRTLFVLWRAIVFAAPAGAVIWLVANVHAGDATIAEHLIRALDPFGVAIGLNGIILLAYVIAIPANEIVLPTVLMLTVLVTGTSGVGEGAGVLFQLDSSGDTLRVLEAGGWTLLTGVNLMLFSLAHNPCSTTLHTMYRETKSARWTTLAALLPLALGILLTFAVARVWRLVS